MNKRFAALALSVLFLTACGGGTSVSPSATTPAPSPTVDKYAQTWTKSYSKTTCKEWLNAMTPAQQFAVSAEILTNGRNKVDEGTGMPSDSLIRDFQTATSDYCTIPSVTLTDATYAVYMDGKRFRP